MHFSVLNGSEQKYARARFLWKNTTIFYGKSILTSFIAIEHFSWHSWNKYAVKKMTSKALHVRARNKRNIFEYLIVKLNYSKIACCMSIYR